MGGNSETLLSPHAYAPRARPRALLCLGTSSCAAFFLKRIHAHVNDVGLGELGDGIVFDAVRLAILEFLVPGIAARVSGLRRLCEVALSNIKVAQVWSRVTDCEVRQTPRCVC